LGRANIADKAEVSTSETLLHQKGLFAASNHETRGGKIITVARSAISRNGAEERGWVAGRDGSVGQSIKYL